MADTTLISRFALLAVFVVAVQTAEGQRVLWEKTGDTGIGFSAHNRALYMSPTGDLYVGIYDGLGCGDYCGSSGLIFRSRDGGRSWEQTLFDGEGVTSFSSNSDGNVMAGTFGGLFGSGDKGLTWQEIPTTGVREWIHVVRVTAEGRIYLGIGGEAPILSGGLFSSSDDGSTWQEHDLATSHPWPPLVLDVLESTTGSVFAATDAGVFKGNEQAQWQLTSLDSARTRHLAHAPGGVVFASLWNSEENYDALYRSPDDGQHWVRTALPEMRIASVIATSTGDLFVSGNEGLYGSDTDGDSWELLGAGMDAIVRTSDDFLVGFDSRGELFRSASAVHLETDPKSQPEPAAVSLQNYPNPFADRTTISFSVPEPGIVQLKLFSLTGSRLLQLESGFRHAGNHIISLDAAYLPPGVYFCRLEIDNIITVAPIVVAR